jgi:hypothetical protein
LGFQPLRAGDVTYTCDQSQDGSAVIRSVHEGITDAHQLVAAAIAEGMPSL